MSTKKTAQPGAKKPAKGKAKAEPKHPEVFEETQAPHKFTAEERERMGNDLRGHLDSIDELTGQMKSSTQDFKLRIGNHQNDVKGLRTKLGTGEETRPVRARVEFDAGKRIKRLYFPDTGEFIREDPMQPADFQLPMFKPDDTGKEAPAPKGATDVPSGPSAPEPKNKREKKEPGETAGKTNVGDALDNAASLTDAPQIDLYMAEIDDHVKLTKAFRKAAKEAGWTEPQIGALITQLRAVDTVGRMKEVLTPHIVATPTEQ